MFVVMVLFCSALLAADSTHYGLGFCGWVLTVISWLIVIMTFPLSLCVCMKVSNIMYRCMQVYVCMSPWPSGYAAVAEWLAREREVVSSISGRDNTVG